MWEAYLPLWLSMLFDVILICLIINGTDYLFGKKIKKDIRLGEHLICLPLMVFPNCNML